MTQSSAHQYLDRRPRVGWRMLVPSPGTTRQGFSLFLQVLLSPVAAAAAFPVLPNLTPQAGSGTSTAWLLALAEQRRRRRLLKGCHDGRVQILEYRAPLLRTRRYHGPDPLAPAPALLPTRPLRDVPVDHDEPNRL